MASAGVGAENAGSGLSNMMRNL
ncbi:protein of unknown function (plasmid) [Azospirillum baldaniorum]|uniref:Uncharacterized protein n=1 Tax=Azospirillum baldaniorum TaxID=1064539 RepID=A0A9P1NRN0_9PROT|nr:protein of unknown function [Azospirillum baldaniorum]